MSQTPEQPPVALSPYDVAVRQQAYLEQVKNYTEDGSDETAVALALLLAALLLRYDYEKVSDMPRRVLNNFLADFRKDAKPLVNKLNRDFTKRLKEIVNITIDVTKLNFEKLVDKRPTVPPKPLIWREAQAPMAATGVEPLTMLREFTRGVVEKVANLTAQAWAGKWSVAELLKALNGTKDRLYKDGLLNRLRNEFNALQRTMLQHYHAWVQANVGKLFFDRYQWISVLDAGTTAYCRSHNNRIYFYGAGPTPPAHWNCRSTIMGLVDDKALDPPANFYEWLKRQPYNFAVDLLGAGPARRLAANDLSAKDLPKFESNKKLSPAQFGKKQPKMVA